MVGDLVLPETVTGGVVLVSSDSKPDNWCSLRAASLVMGLHFDGTEVVVELGDVVPVSSASNLSNCFALPAVALAFGLFLR